MTVLRIQESHYLRHAPLILYFHALFFLIVKQYENFLQISMSMPKLLQYNIVIYVVGRHEMHKMHLQATKVKII